VFWRDEVDIMYISHLLEFDVPLRQFFRGQVEAVSLVRNILVHVMSETVHKSVVSAIPRTYMVLTKDTAQIASRKKDRPASMVPLYTWLFTSVGRNDIDLGRFGTD
jgi:hypothetical protein